MVVVIVVRTEQDVQLDADPMEGRTNLGLSTRGLSVVLLRDSM